MRQRRKLCRIAAAGAKYAATEEIVQDGSSRGQMCGNGGSCAGWQQLGPNMRQWRKLCRMAAIGAKYAATGRLEKMAAIGAKENGSCNDRGPSAANGGGNDSSGGHGGGSSNAGGGGGRAVATSSKAVSISSWLKLGQDCFVL